MSDLEIAFEALKGKQRRYGLLWDYYYGKHPLIYSASRLKAVFDKLDAHFSENWCAVVIDSSLDRISLNRLVINGDEEGSKRLNALWKRVELDLEAPEVHRAALVTGESFLMIWADDEAGIEAYYQDPRRCHVFYEPGNPSRKRMAAKWWQEDDGRYRMNLYYPKRLEYYETKPGMKQTPEKANAFELKKSEENPFGVVPVFHFRRERRRVVSELDNVLPIQAAVNKLLADMMVAAEFGAFKQRWVISNVDTDALKNSPNEIWGIPAGDGVGQETKVGEFSATELQNYIGAIDNLVSALGTISRTPKHHFFKLGSEAPSGEALIAMESPINKKCRRYVNNFANTWQRAVAFLAQLEGGDAVADPEVIEAVFEEPETVQPHTRAEIRQLEVTAGIPLVTSLRNEGWSDSKIGQMETDRAAEQAAMQESLAQALLEQQRKFDQETPSSGRGDPAPTEGSV